MATNKQPIFLNSVISKAVEIDNATGTSANLILSGGTDGGVVTNLMATTTDTSDVVVVISKSDGLQTNVIGEVAVAAGSGTDGASPSVNLLDATALAGALQNDGSIVVGASGSLSVSAKSAVTATKLLSVTADGGLYGV